jgi:hypothetical protein
MGWTAENPLLWNIVLPLTWDTIRDRCQAIEASHGFVAEAPRVLFYADRAFPILDLEVAVPIPSTGKGTWDLSNVVHAWYDALNYAYANQGDFPLTTCLHARFTKTSQSLLSAAYSPNIEDRVCWIEILSAYPKSEPNPQKRAEAMKPHLAMIQNVVAGWIEERGGRPHWAKNWQYLQPLPQMRELFPPENLRAFPVIGQLLHDVGPVEGQVVFRETPAYRSAVDASPLGGAGLLAQFRYPLAVERAVRLVEVPRNRAFESEAELASLGARMPTAVIGAPRDPVHPFPVAEHWAGALGSPLTRLPARDDGQAAQLTSLRAAFGTWLAA